MPERIDLVGERVRLRSTVSDDGPALVAIRRTDAVRRWWRGEDLDAEFAADLLDGETVRLTIEADGRVIGLIQYYEEPDEEYRHASIDIYIDPAVHRRGFATDAIRTLVDHLFDERGHHRLTIDPAVDNRPAVDCYASVGFTRVGVMRRHERRPDGTWADGLLMEMLDSDRTDSPGHSSLVFAGAVLNARDPDGLATFYERLLGWHRFMDESDWIAIRRGDRGTAIAFQRDSDVLPPTWPATPGSQQMTLHLDFVTDDLDTAVDHAVASGATMTVGRSSAGDEQVLLDPAGNPFCLIARPAIPSSE